jgi:hypothetical protein
MKKYLILLLLLSTTSFAQTLEAGVGVSRYLDGMDGWWYQQPFPHQLHLAAPAVEIGLTGSAFTLGADDVAWHLDWAYLGSVHTKALAVTSDANYNPHTHQCYKPCWPLAEFDGSGHSHGIVGTLEPLWTVGEYQIGVELGVYYHRSTWAVNVYGWVPSQFAAPSNIFVGASTKWLIGGVTGLTVHRNGYYVKYQFMRDNGVPGDPYSPAWHANHTFIFGKQF